MNIGTAKEGGPSCLRVSAESAGIKESMREEEEGRKRKERRGMMDPSGCS